MPARKLLFAVTVLLIACTPLAKAQGEEWSFDRNPFQRLTATYDKDWIIDLFSYRSLSRESCKGILEKHYEIYIKIYPAYARWAHEPGMREKWRNAMMLIDWASIDCPYADIIDPLVLYQPTSQNAFYYCGHLSRPPQNIEERRIEALIKVLIDQISAGEPLATGMLINHENWSLRHRMLGWQGGLEVRLNTDVEYALRLWLYQLMPGVFEDTPPYDGVASYAAELTPERHMFVGRAVREGRIERIFSTTEKCSP